MDTTNDNNKRESERQRHVRNKHQETQASDLPFSSASRSWNCAWASASLAPASATHRNPYVVSQQRESVNYIY